MIILFTARLFGRRHLTLYPVRVAHHDSKLRSDGAPLSRAALISLLALLFTTSPMGGQTTAGASLNEYTSAVARVQPADRIRDLQRVAETASGQVRVDALGFVVWEYLRSGNLAHALTWANELQMADKSNALALAVICEAAQNSTPITMKADQLLSTAHEGINALPQLRRPLGMSESDFGKLRQKALAMLKAAAGNAELQRKEYLAARSDLHDAVALDPGRVRNLYALALADLNGKNPDPKEGYWNLARSVELTRGTPPGAQIAKYARDSYVGSGGTNAGWDQFLVAAAAANRGLAPKTHMTTTNALSANSRTEGKPSTTVQPSSRTVHSTTTVAKAAQPPVTLTKSSSYSAPATEAGTAYSPPPVRPHNVSGGRISLGILIETSLTKKVSRTAIVGALTDMVRHMGDDDEAFVLTYDNHLVFEQDLTTDPHQIEEAMENIKPQKGAELEEAVAFAAGHLARIAKYPNRVLLVISDGRNVDGHASPLQTSAQINAAAVRIYCIGMEVMEREGQYRLQALSSNTGGRAEFVASPQQIRQATEKIAQNIGIDFRF
jgi:hypothetical protein